MVTLTTCVDGIGVALSTGLWKLYMSIIITRVHR
jgi:hypothetical protein